MRNGKGAHRVVLALVAMALGACGGDASTDAGPNTDTDAGADAAVPRQDAGARADSGPPPDAGPLRGVVFHSDWSTALGQGDDALFDTDKEVPWDGFIGNGRGNAVVSAEGLDFPTANVLEVNAIARDGMPGASAQNLTLFTDSGHIPVPANGGDLFYRWYIRVTVPDSYTADPSTHPIEDSPGTGTQNWNFVVDTSPDGTWELTFQSGANDWPNHRWSCPRCRRTRPTAWS